MVSTSDRRRRLCEFPAQLTLHQQIMTGLTTLLDGII